MSAVKGWTPGPWFVGASFHHSGERQRVTPIYARHPDRLDGQWLVAWCHQNAVPAKQVKQNARLIAAAPELLALAHKVADNVVLAGMDIGAQARAAIAAATGESK